MCSVDLDEKFKWLNLAEISFFKFYSQHKEFDS